MYHVEYRPVYVWEFEAENILEAEAYAEYLLDEGRGLVEDPGFLISLVTMDMQKGEA